MLSSHSRLLTITVHCQWYFRHSQLCCVHSLPLAHHATHSHCHFNSPLFCLHSHLVTHHTTFPITSHTSVNLQFTASRRQSRLLCQRRRLENTALSKLRRIPIVGRPQAVPRRRSGAHSRGRRIHNQQQVKTNILHIAGSVLLLPTQFI